MAYSKCFQLSSLKTSEYGRQPGAVHDPQFAAGILLSSLRAGRVEFGLLPKRKDSEGVNVTFLCGEEQSGGVKRKKAREIVPSLLRMVGASGFEPPTTRTPSVCAIQAALRPVKSIFETPSAADISRSAQLHLRRYRTMPAGG